MKDKRNEEIESALKILQRAIPDLLAIYLFGSFNTEFQSAGSDLDLAILAREKKDPVALWYLAQEIACNIHRDVDLIDLQSASTVFRFQVIATGKRIVCKDEPKCDSIENTYLSMYLRFNEERKEILKDLTENEYG